MTIENETDRRDPVTHTKKSWTNKMRPVRWCYDFELAERDQRKDIFMLATGFFQFLLHKGDILLSQTGIVLLNKKGMIKEDISFDRIETIYIGYDDLYPRRLSKNFGTFWAPLRITFNSGARVYLIIYGSMGLLVRNGAWFDYLKEVLG